MKIEVGKFYKTRDGLITVFIYQRVTIKNNTDNSTTFQYYGVATRDQMYLNRYLQAVYSENGVFLSEIDPSYDLIEETGNNFYKGEDKNV